MASAKNPVLTVIRNPAAIITWTFTVNYTAVFASSELNQTFFDCIELLERDVTSGDDSLTDPCVDAREFVATGPEVKRTKRVTLEDRDVDTELGREEVYAIVKLLASTTEEQDRTRTNEVEVPT